MTYEYRCSLCGSPWCAEECQHVDRKLDELAQRQVISMASGATIWFTVNEFHFAMQIPPQMFRDACERNGLFEGLGQAVNPFFVADPRDVHRNFPVWS